MKQLYFLFCVSFLLLSCIQDDIIDDQVAEEFIITNPINEITLNKTYQYTTKYTDNVGKSIDSQVNWQSSDVNLATINTTGLITGIAEGDVIITASVTSSEGKTITTENRVTVTSKEVDNTLSTEKKGVIQTTSSYVLRGNFTLKEIPDTNDLELSIADDYSATTSLPGLYLYFTNNTSTINNAKEIGKVTVFNGSHKYIIKDTELSDFTHLLYWCKPFGVKVGEGEIEQ